jgi:hypothetical protein
LFGGPKLKLAAMDFRVVPDHFELPMHTVDTIKWQVKSENGRWPQQSVLRRWLR